MSGCSRLRWHQHCRSKHALSHRARTQIAKEFTDDINQAIASEALKDIIIGREYRIDRLEAAELFTSMDISAADWDRIAAVLNKFLSKKQKHDPNKGGILPTYSSIKAKCAIV
jgi:hypothetical protein